MDITQMRYYIKAYDEKKISSAAEMMYISPQYMSKTIKKIEDELGVQLFFRNKKGLQPTKNGSLVYQSFKKIVDEYLTLNNEINSQVDLQTLPSKITIVMDAGLPQFLPSDGLLTFVEKNPQKEIFYDEHRNANCMTHLLENKADFGVTICNRPDPRFTYFTVCKISGEILVANSHPLSKRATISIEDLSKEKLVFCEQLSYYLFLNEFNNMNLLPNITYSINDSKIAMDFIKHQSGVRPIIKTRGNGTTIFGKGIQSIPYSSENTWTLCVYCVKNKESNPFIPLFLKNIQSYY